MRKKIDDRQGLLSLRPAVTAALLVLALLTAPCGWIGGYQAAAKQAQDCQGAGVGWRVARQFLSEYPVSEVVSADFNGDGKADLALSEPEFFGSIPGMTIALGDGSGYFEQYVRVEVVGSLRNLKVLDIDGDGRPEIIFSGLRVNETQAIGALSGSGDGTFAVRRLVSTMSDIIDYALADFNGDARLDIAITTGQPGGSLVLAFGNPAGGFDLQEQPINLTFAPLYLTTADFNNDGKADLAAALSPGYRLEILLGAGDGSFTVTTGPEARSFARAVQSEDLDGDGNTDLIVVESGELEIFNGDGEGGFKEPARFNTIGLTTLKTGDFNGDGMRDLALLSGALRLLVNDGEGGLVEGESFVAGKAPSSLAAGDFNGDGLTDLAASDPPQQAVTILLNSGQSRFIAPVIFGAGLIGPPLVIGDLNDDGHPDLVGSGQIVSVMSVALADGMGGFAAPVNYNQPFVTHDTLIATAIADFNQDGKADLAVAVREIANFDGALVLLAGNGSGTFSASRRRRLALPSLPQDLAASDFNGDSLPDLVAVNPSTNDLSLLLNDGRGGFNEPVSIGVGLEPRSLAVADFNGDGRSDLAVANRNSVTLSILLGNGSAGFDSTLIGIGANPLLVKTADFNDDGKIDLIVPHFGSQSVSVLTGRGDGSFAAPIVSPVGALAQSIAIADFNLDGRLDFAMTARLSNESLDNARIFYGVGSGRFTFGEQLLAPRASMVNVADVNDDGLVELLTSARLDNFSPGIFITRVVCNDPAPGLTSVSAASYRRVRLAEESIVAAFGAGLSTETVMASSLPLPTGLGGASVRVRDSAGIERLAPLFFVSPNQINYLMPRGSAAGPATITVLHGEHTVSGASEIAAVAPGLFAANASGHGAAAAITLRIKPDGRQIYEPVARFDPMQNQFVLMPIDLYNSPENVLDTVYLILFGTGIRKRSSLDSVRVMIGDQSFQVLYAGAQGEFAGLDQVNLRLTGIGRGEANVRIIVDGQMSNAVRIAIL